MHSQNIDFAHSVSNERRRNGALPFARQSSNPPKIQPVSPKIHPLPYCFFFLILIRDTGYLPNMETVFDIHDS
jgi:hypothetical protein